MDSKVLIFICCFICYSIGYYRAWLRHGHYVCRDFMTGTCEPCKGHGATLGMQTLFDECSKCGGTGKANKKGFRYWFMHTFFKWTSF